MPACGVPPSVRPSVRSSVCLSGTSKSKAAVIGNKKNCAVGVLKLTTDKHEALRGLSATAELLVTAAL